MNGRVIGIIGGSGLYQIDGLEKRRLAPRRNPVRRNLGRILLRHAGRPGGRLPAAPWPRPCAAAVGDQFSRQYRRAEALRRHRHRLAVGGRQPARGSRARRFRRSSTSSSTAPSRARRASSAPAASRMSRWRTRCVAGSATRSPRPARAPAIVPKRGGTYLVMEGPQFSTLAESNLYRSWGCDVIGMTNMPEAKLAREAEICYATVAMVTDYDCWHPAHDAVTVEMILGRLNANAAKARALVKAVVPLLAGHDGPCRQGCDHALDTRADHRARAPRPGIARPARRGCRPRARRKRR